jgi:NAD(P)-dependent dehydrogenase (short-subunit alcohol dehydrogenase family)
MPEGLPGAVVITGGASGIGRGSAIACAELGAPVAILDVDSGAAEEAAAEAGSRGAPQAVGLGCDVRDETSVGDAIDAAAKELGPIRGLVTCAGIDRGGLVHELDADVWNDMIAVNLTGTFLTCRQTLSKMLDHGLGGSIVCASSPFATISAPGGASAYCATKGGVSAFVRSLALDYVEHSIRVNAIVPGATETELMWASFSEDEVPEARRRVGEQIPYGRLAEVDEIAEGIVWLLSDKSGYVTGSHLAVDGGLMARAHIEA